MRLGDHLSADDYPVLYGDHWTTRSSRKTRLLVAVLILGWILAAALLAGCDGEAAQVTAKIERDAYERFMDVQAEARYRLTDQPIKASTLEVSLTVCQQYPEINRKWQCWGVQ